MHEILILFLVLITL